MTLRRATLLVGSPKAHGESTSEALGRYLCDRLAAGGVAWETLFVSALHGARIDAKAVPSVAGADLFVLASPVYDDALPAPVTAVLEHLASARARWADRPPVRFLAVVNCGFPEPRHTEIALAICRAFADEAGLAWAGGLGVGGGEALNGVSLERAGKMAARVRRALGLTADALLQDRPVPDAAAALLASPLVPSRLYTLMGNVGWLRAARRHGTLRRLWDRPYA